MRSTYALEKTRTTQQITPSDEWKHKLREQRSTAKKLRQAYVIDGPIEASQAEGNISVAVTLEHGSVYPCNG